MVSNWEARMKLSRTYKKKRRRQTMTGRWRQRSVSSLPRHAAGRERRCLTGRCPGLIGTSGHLLVARGRCGSDAQGPRATANDVCWRHHGSRAQRRRETTGRWGASGQRWPNAFGRVFRAEEPYWKRPDSTLFCVRWNGVVHLVDCWLECRPVSTVGIERTRLKTLTRGEIWATSWPRVSGHLVVSPFVTLTALFVWGAYK
jgi:hypothetical protein